jgi:hypothetical protein
LNWFRTDEKIKFKLIILAGGWMDERWVKAGLNDSLASVQKLLSL